MVSVDDLASVGHPQTLRASEASSHRRPRSLRYTRPRIHQSAAYSERRIQEHLAEAREILKLSSPSSEMREPAQSSLQACFGQCQVLQCDYFGRISMPLVATSLKLPKTLKSRITRLAKRGNAQFRLTVAKVGTGSGTLTSMPTAKAKRSEPS